MTRLFLIRHGQTAWNKAERFRGRADVPLDEVGQAEAAALGHALAALELDALYASPLSRCHQTLAPLAAARGLEIATHEGLADIDFGTWQGRPRTEVRAAEPELYRQWLEHPEQVTFPRGEGLAQVRERALAAVDEIRRRHPDATVAACSHRVVCKVLILGLLGVPDTLFWRLRQDATCVNVFDLDGAGATLVRCNDTHHARAVSGSGTLADF